MSATDKPDQTDNTQNQTPNDKSTGRFYFPLAVRSKPLPNGEKNEWAEMIQVNVGPDGVAFIIHRNILQSVSFFRCCLESTWSEGRTGIVKLPLDDALAFREIVEFLYRDRISCSLGMPCLLAERGDPASKERQCRKLGEKRDLCFKSYILAYKLGGLALEHFRNNLVDGIIASLKLVPLCHTEYQYTMDHTIDGDPLRVLIMEVVSRDIQQKGWDQWIQAEDGLYQLCIQHDPERMTGIAEGLAKYPNAESCWTRVRAERCRRWHSHKDSSRRLCIGSTLFGGYGGTSTFPHTGASNFQ